jgi:hypothetical protein
MSFDIPCFTESIQYCKWVSLSPKLYICFVHFWIVFISLARAYLLNYIIYWDVTPCSPVEFRRRFGGSTWCFLPALCLVSIFPTCSIETECLSVTLVNLYWTACYCCAILRVCIFSNAFIAFRFLNEGTESGLKNLILSRVEMWLIRRFWVGWLDLLHLIHTTRDYR